MPGDSLGAMKALRAIFAGRGILAAVLVLVLLTQIQTTMACALTDSIRPADCPCQAPDPISADGCTDMVLPSEAAGCCAFGLDVAPKVVNADDPAASGPVLTVDSPQTLSSPAGVRAAGLPPPTSAGPPVSFAVPDGTGIYLRTARLRL